MPMNKWNDVGTDGIGIAALIIILVFLALVVGAIYLTVMPVPQGG